MGILDAPMAQAIHTHPLSDITIAELDGATDLNTLLKNGYYHQSQSAEASLALNYPEAQAGFLTVIKPVNVTPFAYQSYQVFKSGAMYYRGYYYNAWSAWQKVTNNGTVSAASDPLAYLNNVAILCQFPVRENGEILWPQGISINKADNELYVSNSDGSATVLRIDVRDLTTGVRKSFKQISVTGSTWSEGLPWFKNANGELCFIVRTSPETGVASTYSIFNYTTSVLGSPIAINGPFKSDVNGDTFVTSDAYGHAATTFYIYSWASIQAGTPSLLATVPLENPGQDIGKTQGVAVVGSNLYILTGEQATNPGIMVYDFTGKLLTIRDYAKADFQAAVNVLKPNYLTNNSFIYECEGATNLDGKLVTGQIVNNNPSVTADGIMLVLQHNRIDGAHIKSRPLAGYVRDTGWVTLTPASGWTIGGGINIQARRIGNEVRLRGHPLNASTTAATWTTLATLPAGMWPATSVQFAQSSNTTATMAVRVNSNGTIDSYSSVATGAWRPLNGITFLLD